MNLFYLVLISILFTSCEGFVVVKGNIISAKTDSIITGAKIELLGIPIEKK